MDGKRDDCIRWLLSQPPDKQYEVKPYRKRRSLNANSYFHVLCQKIADKMDVSIYHIKNSIMSDYGQIDREVPLVILPDDLDWRENKYLHLHPTAATKILEDHKVWRVFCVIRGSHTYDTREMARLIDGAIQEAKALDIETIPPAELARMMSTWKGEKNEG